ncbi:MAG: DUF2490 domain-containing protein [Candidatus Omnitrophica bacterium]|nr:DUF2490 domain-containing protein [Candidatus Omnitrophota bacterium]
MRKVPVLTTGLVLAVLNLASAYDDGDFQVWNTDVEEFKVDENSKIALEEEFRWGDNANEFYYHHYDAGFFYNAREYLNLGGGYRHIYELKKGKFKLESEPYLTATLSGGLKGLKFDDRSRLEYRHFEYQADSWRYRNKITMKLPWKFTGMSIQPYLSDETFFGFGGTNQFNQNRLSCGLAMNLTKDIKGEVYYMLQSAKSSAGWVDTNVLGTKLKIVF